jgi:hypothetical protein
VVGEAVALVMAQQQVEEEGVVVEEEEEVHLEGPKDSSNRPNEPSHRPHPSSQDRDKRPGQSVRLLKDHRVPCPLFLQTSLPRSSSSSRRRNSSVLNLLLSLSPQHQLRYRKS